MHVFADLKKYSHLMPYTPALVCLLLMLPRLLSPQFGLLDDGRGLSVAEGITNGVWDFSWDMQGERFRPLFWLAFTFWYLLVGGTPFWYFLGNWVVFTVTTLVLIHLVLELGGSRQQAWVSGLFFALSGPVIENVYTLNKGENLQVMLLSLALLLTVLSVRDFKKGKLITAFSLVSLLILAACLTKETTPLIAVVSLVWWASAELGRKLGSTSAIFASQISRFLAFAGVLGGGVFYLARSILVSSQLTGVGYTSNFIFETGQILNALVRWGGWLLRDYTWLAPLGLVVVIACIAFRRWPASWLWWFAGIWMAIFLGLYLPWYFAVEYYLLPVSAGAGVLAGVLFVETTRLLKHVSIAWRALGSSALGLSALLFTGSLVNNAASASVQLAQDAANSGVLSYVAEYAPPGSAVIVNIQSSNEYVEQIQLLLADYYDRPDLNFTFYQQQDLSQLVSQFPAVLVLVPELENQPLMTVRMGLIEESQQVWNSSLPFLAPESWQVVYQISRQSELLTVDFPRLLCPVIYRENYCSATGGLINYRVFRYQWTVYQSR